MLNKRWNRKLIVSINGISDGKVATDPARKKIEGRVVDFTGIHVANNDTSMTIENLVGRVPHKFEGKEFSFETPVQRQAGANGLHKFTGTCTSILDDPCAHVIAILQRLSMGRRTHKIITNEKFVHPHRSLNH